MNERTVNMIFGVIFQNFQKQQKLILVDFSVNTAPIRLRLILLQMKSKIGCRNNTNSCQGKLSYH